MCLHPCHEDICDIAITANPTSVSILSRNGSRVRCSKMGGSCCVLTTNCDEMSPFCFSADGEWIIGSSSQHDILLWDGMQTNSEGSAKCFGVFRGNTDRISCLVLSRNRKKWLASASLCKVVVWDVSTRKQVCTVETENNVSAIALSRMEQS